MPVGLLRQLTQLFIPIVKSLSRETSFFQLDHTVLDTFDGARLPGVEQVENFG